ncbi:hypothetical protein BDC45DRAFT_507692 [Circinella umbellata]|nr:hypothetical protein BDC45DRAFT_507692 [Circinella umbellata]
MMQKLLDFDCTEIESLEFVSSITGSTAHQQTVFLNLLRRLALHRLTVLDMKRHNQDFSILDLLFVCPHLTHFSFQAFVINSRDDDDNDDDEVIQLLPSDQIIHSNLIYLHSNSDSCDIIKQINSIICRSPNLRYFIDGNIFTSRTESEMLTSPELVFSRCPKLEYYVGNGKYEFRDKPMRGALIQSSTSTASLSTTMTTKSNHNKTSSNSSDNNDQERQNALQYLSISHNWSASQTISILRKYKDTLKHVSFGGTNSLKALSNPYRWMHTFQNIFLQQLHTLVCDNIYYNIEFIITLLNTCCDTIQEVRLYPVLYEPTMLDVPTLQKLQILPQLRTLSIINVTFLDDSSVLALFERLPSLENLTFRRSNSFKLPEQAAPLLKNLKHLTLLDVLNGGSYSMRFESDLLVNPEFFVSLARCGSKLESVTLKSGSYVGIPFIVLNALASLPSLKRLDVNGIDRYFNEKCNDEKEEQQVVEFLKRCYFGFDNNINSNITKVAASTTIKHLTLHCVSKLTFTMLNILGDFTNLENLHISLDESIYRDNDQSLAGSDKTCLNLDLCGVLDLLRKSKKLKSVLFEEVASFEYLSSYYLKNILVKQQQINLQLRKYSVEPSEYYFESRISFENLQIINKHYN